MEPDPFEPPDPPPPLTPPTPPAGALVNVLSVLVAPFVVAWDALGYLRRVVLPTFGSAFHGALEFLGRIATGIARIIGAVVRPFRRLLSAIVNLVVRVMEATALAWSVILMPVVRIVRRALDQPLTSCGRNPCAGSEPDWAADLHYPHPLRLGGSVVSKKTKKRKLRARRNKANHGKRPNVGRR